MEYYECKSDELMHYGRKGMKWGYHKFHNADGSLNAIGKQKFDKVSKVKLEPMRIKPELFNPIEYQKNMLIIKTNYTRIRIKD